MENTSGGPFPGPSSNNLPFPKLSRSATDHERVLDTLENEFKRMDKMFAKGETRVFGRNSDNIFKELDLIRKKQIALAIQHTALENSPEKEAPFGGESPTLTTNEAFKRNADRFIKSEKELNFLMEDLNELIEKLEDFGQSMSQPSKVSK